ncbi:hypothetical protein H6800_00570 [Candidatus Nomurabacteria bacterium]|nr:hypothetical protein [Candidatus Nomurabacteria bacterium]
MEDNRHEPCEEPEISHHEYYLISGMVRRLGAKATQFVEAPRRIKARVVEFIDELSIASGNE